MEKIKNMLLQSEPNINKEKFIGLLSTNKDEDKYILLFPTLDQLFFNKEQEKEDKSIILLNNLLDYDELFLKNKCNEKLSFITEEFYRDLRSILFHYETKEDFLEELDLIKSKIKTMLCHHFKIESIERIGSTEKEKEEGIRFLNDLTTLESRALDAIIESMEEPHCNILIINLINKTGISRTTFNGLLNKLKNNKISIINNRGVKGLEIKMLNNFIWEELKKKNGNK